MMGNKKNHVENNAFRKRHLWHRGTTMRKITRKTLLGLLLSALVFSSSCMQERPDRDYVQTNVVDKSLFEGEWYYTHTIIDNDQESTYAWAYRGSVSFDITNSVIGTIARIRFIIDEDFLYAFRSYPIVADADRTPDGGRDMDTFEPMAAWPIEDHFDIVNRYHPETGEIINVREENSQDRPWYERRYMRVDWSGNVLTGGFNFNDLDVYDPLGVVVREPAASFVQDGSEWPAQWGVQFHYTPAQEPEATEWQWEYWDRYGSDELYHFSFVVQEVWQPGISPFLYSWALPAGLQYADEIPTTASLVTVRHAFLRVPEENQYEPLPMPESEWEQFGSWRVEQPTYVWGDLPDEDDGLTNFYGRTDSMNFWAGRHNIWRRSFEYDDQGRQVPIPAFEREIQPVVYTLSERFPAWLIRPSFELIGEWNASMMTTVREIRGEELPVFLIDESSCSTDQECLDEFGETFPLTSCRTSFDGSSSKCTRPYNPFLNPNEALNDFDCHVVDQNGQAPSDPGLSLGVFDDDSLADQRGWRFVGSECVLTLRNNTCDDPVALAAAIEINPACEENPDLCCDQMGDLRFNMLAFNDQVGVMFGGVSQPLMDPLTGELIQANANAAGVSVEGAMTYVGWYFNLVDGSGDDIDELSMMVGEDVRALMEESNYAIPPVNPAIPPSMTDIEGSSGADLGDFRSAYQHFPPRFRESMEKARLLRGMDGRTKIHSDRMSYLEGTNFERMLFSGPDGMLSMGIIPEDRIASPTEEQLDLGSVFRHGFFPMEREYSDLRERMSSRNFHPSADQEITSFTDNSYVNWLRDFPPGTTDQQRAIAIGRSYFRSMMLHEMGHSLGMRHNFAASLDHDNYHDQYYRINAQYPLPSSSEYDLDEDEVLSYEELAQFNADTVAAREQRELAGISRWHNASIMEYMPRISNDLAPLGRYDKGFIHFIYGNRIEVYTDLPSDWGLDTPGEGIAWLNRPDRASRTTEQYYQGGEICRIDRDTNTGNPERFHHEDCPYGVMYYNPETRSRFNCGSDNDCAPYGMVCRVDRGWCMSPLLPENQRVGQRCAQNPRSNQSEHREDLPGVCLGYAESWTEYRGVVGDTSTDIFPINYRFCSDDRASDISWCNRFDEGGSFREVMTNYRDSWVRNYPLQNFRRYRALYNGTNNFRTFYDIAKIMSHLFYRLFYENLIDADGDEWVDSMEDHLAGAAIGMNFLSEVIAQPDVGSYSYNPDTNAYELVESEELGMGDIDVPVGLGRYMWSSYQEGPFGIQRMERQGSYLDKFYALYALARREWGMSYNYDERFWINFYSLFPYEMAQLFGGLILDDPQFYGARVCTAGRQNPLDPRETCDRTTIFYQDLWRGFDFTEDVPRDNPYDDIFGELPSIAGGSNEMLRTWAVILSLAEFPVFYDTTYEQTLYLFIEGTGTSFEVRECTEYPDDDQCLEEGSDFVRYFSDRFNLSIVALNVEPEWDWEPESINTSFVIVQRAVGLRDAIDACTGPDFTGCSVPASEREEAVERWQYELERTESFLINIMDIQSIFGISSWL